MTMISSLKTPPRGEVTITRHFDAPRDLVFRMWTDPKLLAQWWGPKDFTNPVCEVDLKVGGELVIVMRAPYGNEHPMKGIFREIKSRRRSGSSSGISPSMPTAIIFSKARRP